MSHGCGKEELRGFESWGKGSSLKKDPLGCLRKNLIKGWQIQLAQVEDGASTGPAQPAWCVGL